MNGITQPGACNFDPTQEPLGELVKDTVASVTLRDPWISLKGSPSIGVIKSSVSVSDIQLRL